MLIVLFPLLLVLLTFGLIVFVGPPYVPTLRRQKEVALDLLQLQPGQTMLELGSGDGRVALAAAKRGWNVVGIELNPFLVLLSLAITWRYRQQVRIVWGGYFSTRWPEAQGIFTFMLPRHMGKLDRHIAQACHKPVRLASFAFEIPGRKPIQVREGVFLYQYK